MTTLTTLTIGVAVPMIDVVERTGIEPVGGWVEGRPRHLARPTDGLLEAARSGRLFHLLFWFILHGIGNRY
jgi:hypothetical protein